MLDDQFDAVKNALAAVPDEGLKNGAQNALRTILATVELMGARIMAFQEIMPRGEDVGLSTVVCRAVDVLGDPEKACRWLGSPIQALGGRTPKEMAATDPQSVLAVLTRIEYGVHG